MVFFSLFIYFEKGDGAAFDFLTGYTLEKTMSMDNIFVIAAIFKFFSVPQKYQHRVLLYGILGVIILRAIMISVGAILIDNLSWILYLFAIFLILTGFKILLIPNHHQLKIQEMWVYKFLKQYIRIYPKISSNNFFCYVNGKIHATPLFIAMITIEFMDIIFAIDSIPVIFSITQDTIIIYTSNIFAILGLRAMYFLLADLSEKFVYIKHAVGLILIFIGMKIFINHYYQIPKLIPLLLTIILITCAIILSPIKNKKVRQ